jgi:hypothetical protein
MTSMSCESAAIVPCANQVSKLEAEVRHNVDIVIYPGDATSN